MSVPILWRQRTWRVRAMTWVDRRLRERGLAITGKPDQFHVVPWSTVFRAPTDHGDVYFKATWPGQRREAGITAALARWAPGDVGTPLAVDARHGWLLLEDAGPRLRQIITKDRDIRHWHRVLPQYAQLQIAIAQHAHELLRLGAPDRRAKRFATEYERLLDEPSLLRVGLTEGLTTVQEGTLRDVVLEVRTLAREISIVPDTIQHDDLHDGQVFVQDGRYRILDWGDAVVSHPFYSMSVVERSVAYTLKLKPGSREITRLRDLYLEPFTKFASAKQLRVAYRVAIRLGWISRALTWASVVPHLSPAKKREERGDVPRSLGRFLDSDSP